MSFGFSGAWWQSGGATNANNLIFSPDGLSIQQNYYNAPSGYATGYVLSNQASGTGFCFAAKWTGLAGYSNFGIVQGGPVAAIHSSTTAILLNNAGTVTIPGSSGFSVSGISGSAGVAYFYVNAAFTKFWVSIDAGAGGATWQDGSGTNKTTALIEAGVGGATTGGLTGPFDAFFEFFTAGTTGVASLIPIASWPAAAPTGAVDLTGGLATKLLPAAPSGAVSAVFSCPNTTSGTIECSLTGTSGWFSAGGGNTGTSGTLTAGTEPTGQQGLATTYYFRDSGNTANQGIPQLLFSITPPAGAGPVVATDSLFLRGATQPSTTYPISAGPDTKIYVAAAFVGGNYGTATTLGFKDGSGNPVITFAFDDTLSGRNNIEFTGGPTGPTGATSVYSPHGTTSLMTGTLDASTISGGSAYGTFSFTDIVNAVTGGLGPSAWPPGTLTTPRFDHLVYLDIGGSYGANAFGQTLAFAVYSSPLVETLTLASVSNVAGSLLATGSVVNGSLTTSIDLDIGSGYVPSTSFTLTGGAWSATGQALSPGTFTVTAKDPATGVISNGLSLVVSTEFITIVTSVGTFGVALDLQGTDVNGPASAMDVAYDGTWLGTLSAFTTTGGSDAIWSGTGPVLPFGTETVQVRNHGAPSIVSNVITLAATVPINIWPAVSVPSLTLQNTIPAYLYQQYIDDENLQAFVASYNTLAQQEVDWFNQLNFPVYAGNPQVVGNVLDWVGAALYGYPRPVLASPNTQYIGAIATAWIMQLSIMGLTETGSGGVFVTSDDIYKRVLTWYLYRGDGMQFNIKWLKRRIMRFIYGVDGTDFIIDQTYPVSITMSGDAVTISLIGTPGFISSVFSSAVASGILALPPFYTYSVST